MIDNSFLEVLKGIGIGGTVIVVIYMLGYFGIKGLKALQSLVETLRNGIKDSLNSIAMSNKDIAIHTGANEKHLIEIKNLSQALNNSLAEARGNQITVEKVEEYLKSKSKK